ncbi:EAL domain-containing protein [Loktanella sp. SALINAS62]|uniref:putative bifunctional diguanylate cyclase/phosphodiesterase n=1 Tax=Loktanella sp. SALINAS62 TaxID=2706124 RepID=UPI001B8C06BF|nr:EAL domain-containing protein [Loktanella sp. SALINAS62]MBS1302309.1 EAL domain-containing protein [Loktanella sp. SALINAS62]
MTAINALSDGFVLYDQHDRMVICNEPYKSLYAKSAYRMVPGTRFRDILQAGLDKGEYLDAIGREVDWLNERLADHSRNNSIVEQRLSNGRWLRIEERMTSDGGRVGLRVDITDLKNQQEKLHRMMLTDELTGLRNRRNLLNDLLAWGDSLPPQQGLAVYHLDVERFKQINSVYGYDIGDRLLRHIADTLRAAAGPHGLTARVGGNEFIVAKKIDIAAVDIVDFAETLCKWTSGPVSIDGQQIACCVSAGIAVLDPATCRDGDGSVLAAAEMALAEAKQLGRSVQLFQPTMQVRAVNDGDLTRDLQRAVECNEFEAFFQPQVDAIAQRCIGFEALLRWVHPERGILPAGAFLAIAQRAGLTETLDDLVLDRACRALTFLDSIGRSDLTVSVNLSANQVADTRLLSRLLATLRRHDVARHRIRLELLESTLLDERTSHYIANIEKLVQAGFVMELDDFGTGHAAIATLRKFKVSQIKIDRSFVQNVDHDPELQELTGAIISLAQRLGICILAEGVETAAEQACLVSMGCSRAQGWFYDKALPLSKLPDFLRIFEASV